MQRRLLVGLGLLITCCMLMGFAAPNASAQAVYGSILGTVTDPQGAAVAGAKVTVTSIEKGTADETTTNESGNYTVTHLIPGSYKITIEAQGFKKQEIASVAVSADTGAKADATLQVGAVTQTVEVTGELPQLKTDRSDVSITFNEKYVEDLPILNRNFTSFELLSPGTQKLVGWSHAATENPQGGQQIFVNGQHFSGTAFELDGTDNQDPILGIIVVNPNLDAIQESKITLQNYDAEFGKAVAGIVTVQTKSGSNEFHGSGFYDFRGDGQEARDPFQNAPNVPLPHASFKQFGGAVGGPIIKNRLFFFGDYQGTRQTGGLTQTETIPTLLAEQSCNPATNAQSSTPGFCNLSDYLGVANGGGRIFDPASSTALDGSGRAEFAGALIPINRISPEAAKILAAFPTPTASGIKNNYIASGSGPYDQNSFDTRIDYAAPHNYNVFGRFSLDYFSLSGKGALGVLGGDGFGPGGLNGTSNVHNYSLATGFDKAIGSKWLTDLRFGWFRYNPQTAYSDGNTSPMLDTFGIPGLNDYNRDGNVNAFTGGLSSFFFGGNGLNNGNNNGHFGDGLNVGRCNCPLTEKEDQYQVVNNWTRLQGNHTIKFGADIRYAKNLRVPSDSNRTGILNFNSGDTADAGNGGLDLATFLLGDVTSFQRFVSTSTNAAERQKRWFFYGQDTWRITPKLTFNYGLRWEIYFPESVNAKGNGGFANIDPGPNGGIIRVAGYGSNSLSGNVNNSLDAFAPRLGIAYQWDPKTVIRLGYGRSFDIGVFGSNFGHVVTQNLPVLANQDLSDSSFNGGTNDRTAIFTLGCPTPAPAYCAALTQGASPLPPINIPSDGILPLRGPANSVDPRVRPTKQVLPTLDAWNATVQRQITPTLNVEIGYIGNKGTHVFAGTGPAYNANPVAIGSGTAFYSCSQITDANNPNVGQYACAPSFKPSIGANSRRPYNLNNVPAFIYPTCSVSQQACGLSNVPVADQLTCCATDIGNYFGNNASSNYNALQVKVEKRFAQGLQFLTHYTYSHANNYDSNYY
ncbi:MAG TPA: TonB-dependent receptor, partial [Dongiaceae bacterium]|nr:TonB-dependent receptor [Dongiaceae bacterium]